MPRLTPRRRQVRRSITKPIPAASVPGGKADTMPTHGPAGGDLHSPQNLRRVLCNEVLMTDVMRGGIYDKFGLPTPEHYIRYNESIHIPLQCALQVASDLMKDKFVDLCARGNGGEAPKYPEQFNMIRSWAERSHVRVTINPGTWRMAGSVFIPPNCRLHAEGAHIDVRNGQFPVFKNMAGKGWYRPQELKGWGFLELDKRPTAFVCLSTLEFQRQGRKYVMLNAAPGLEGGQISAAGKGTIWLNLGMMNNGRFRGTRYIGWPESGPQHKTLGIVYAPIVKRIKTPLGWSPPVVSSEGKPLSGDTDLNIHDCFFEANERAIAGTLGFNPSITNNNFGQTMHPVCCLSASNLHVVGNRSQALDDSVPPLGVFLTATMEGGLIAANSFKDNHYSRAIIIRGYGTLSLDSCAFRSKYPAIVATWWKSSVNNRQNANIPIGSRVGGHYTEDSNFDGLYAY